MPTINDLNQRANDKVKFEQIMDNVYNSSIWTAQELLSKHTGKKHQRAYDKLQKAVNEYRQLGNKVL